jgi:hypothetical protein
MKHPSRHNCISKCLAQARGKEPIRTPETRTGVINKSEEFRGKYHNAFQRYLDFQSMRTSKRQNGYCDKEISKYVRVHSSFGAYDVCPTARFDNTCTRNLSYLNSPLKNTSLRETQIRQNCSSFCSVSVLYSSTWYVGPLLVLASLGPDVGPDIGPDS